ncbi:MAG: site-specific integrase, partial [Lentisphaerota bacterium]
IFEYFQNPDGKRARGTIAYDIFSIKLLLKYLDRTGVLTLPFDPSVLKPVKNGRRLIPPFTREELERLLGGIDRDTPSGKRNYAILLLGLTTGIRAGDVVNIKLQDIDWHRYELSVVQGKTSKRLVIPLEPATGNAIGDYILTRRPKSDSLHLFLTANAPYRKLKNSSALVTVLDDCSKKAGILKIPSRSFHSLRRSLGTFMSNSGVSIHTIAQVLGHSDLSTANRYISADMHLVDCALDFDGIPVGSGVL